MIKRIDKSWIISDEIKEIHKYEFLICEDKFSSLFVDDLDPSDFLLREKLLKENSNGCPSNWIGFEGLNSISESYVYLSLNPNWLDIHFIKSKLMIRDLSEFDIKEQTELVKSEIIKYYEKITKN